MLMYISSAIRSNRYWAEIRSGSDGPDTIISTEQKKGLAYPANPLAALVPEARIELARAKGPLDFESSASTSFTTPAQSTLSIYLNKLSLSSIFAY